MSEPTALPHSDSLNRYVVLSIFAHLFIVFVFLIRQLFFSSAPIEYQAAVKVDLIGLPDKIVNQEVKPAPPSPAEVPEPAAPKETAKSKSLPHKAKPENDAVNLDKTKQKQQEALEKLRQMSAFEKIQADLEKEQKQKKAEARSKLLKGNVISSGSQLAGLSKIEAESYIAQVEQQIRQNWALPQWLAKKDLKAQVRVKFDERGQILSAQVVKSSGNPTFDEIAVDTVQKAAPLPPPPEKFARLMSLEGILFGFPE